MATSRVKVHPLKHGKSPDTSANLRSIAQVLSLSPADRQVFEAWACLVKARAIIESLPAETRIYDGTPAEVLREFGDCAELLRNAVIGFVGEAAVKELRTGVLGGK